jgi:hypothetical protein
MTFPVVVLTSKVAQKNYLAMLLMCMVSSLLDSGILFQIEFVVDCCRFVGKGYLIAVN